MKRILLVLLLLVALPLRAAEPLDNSFLVEEAFNLGPRVSHYLFTFAQERGGAYAGAFTHEWSVGAARGQLGYSVPVERAGAFALTGRYQFGDERAAFTPRLSLVMPAAGGGWGVDVNLPASFVLSERLAAHANAGLTTSAAQLSGGVSLVAEPFRSKLHVLLETRWTRAKESVVIVAPGLRWGFDCRNGMRVVPGIGFPMGSDRSRAMYLYLSIEQPRT